MLPCSCENYLVIPVEYNNLFYLHVRGIQQGIKFLPILVVTGFQNTLNLKRNEVVKLSFYPVIYQSSFPKLKHKTPIAIIHFTESKIWAQLLYWRTEPGLVHIRKMCSEITALLQHAVLQWFLSNANWYPVYHVDFSTETNNELSYYKRCSKEVKVEKGTWQHK